MKSVKVSYISKYRSSGRLKCCALASNTIAAPHEGDAVLEDWRRNMESQLMAMHSSLMLPFRARLKA